MKYVSELLDLLDSLQFEYEADCCGFNKTDYDPYTPGNINKLLDFVECELQIKPCPVCSGTGKVKIPEKRNRVTCKDCTRGLVWTE